MRTMTSTGRRAWARVWTTAVPLALAVVATLGLVDTSASAGRTGASVAAGVSPFNFVSYLDLECFKTSPYTPPVTTVLTRHLNPFLAGLAVHTASVTFNRQLCVPVQKNKRVIPDDVLNVVRWVDPEKFDIVTPALTSPVTLTLTHINPALTGLPVETAVIQTSEQLGVPVAKNGAIPPTA